MLFYYDLYDIIHIRSSDLLVNDLLLTNAKSIRKNERCWYTNTL